MMRYFVTFIMFKHWMCELRSKCCHCGPLSMPVFISIFDDDEAEKAGGENSMQFLFSAAVAAARTLSASHNSLRLPVIANIIKNPWLKIRSFLTIFSLHSSHLVYNVRTLVYTFNIHGQFNSNGGGVGLSHLISLFLPLFHLLNACTHIQHLASAKIGRGQSSHYPHQPRIISRTVMSSKW